jgi:cation diffusion facilitator CzcD-associated flavoprotein CzcO
MQKSQTLDVAIIGAGPYGISIAAHLRARGVRYRIFGRPMESWRKRMPKGMFLKSEACASSLSDPRGHYTLRRYCAEIGADYKPWAFPIPLDLFIGYGLWFQTHLVPELDERLVVSCIKREGLYHLEIEGGEMLSARRVIVATGITAAARVPSELSDLPTALVSHSSEHHDLGCFRGREVIVLGAGQSALETAALLNENGARVQLIARRPSVAWGTDGTAPCTIFQRLRRPMTPLGRGLRVWAYVNAPPVFYTLPEAMRISQVRNMFGPAGAWWLRKRVEGTIPLLLGRKIREATVSDDRVILNVEGKDHESSTITADHVIAATGYEITRKSFPFLAPDLLGEIRWAQCGPDLSRNFQSSARNLYFIGLSSAHHYGPALRFVFGAQQTALRLAAHIAGQSAYGAPARAEPCFQEA